MGRGRVLRPGLRHLGQVAQEVGVGLGADEVAALVLSLRRDVGVNDVRQSLRVAPRRPHRPRVVRRGAIRGPGRRLVVRERGQPLEGDAPAGGYAAHTATACLWYGPWICI